MGISRNASGDSRIVDREVQAISLGSDHETKIIQPTEQIPPDSEFKGYQDYTVQERSYQSV